jgi:hypothetical protein
MMVLIDIAWLRPQPVSFPGDLVAEYRRSPSQQANKTSARRDMANFPFPGIMGRTNRNKDDKNEKIRI